MRVIPLVFQIVALVGGLLFSFSIAQANDNLTVLKLDKALVVFSKAATPPDFGSAERVQLRHYWKQKGVYGMAWYEINFPHDLTAEASTWALYLPNVNMNAEVWLNGSKIGSGGRMSPPISRQWHSPLFFNIPSLLLKHENKLQLRVAAYANQFGSLGKVSIGSESVIRDRYRIDKFESNTVHAITGALALFFAVILFPVWWKRNESLYFWFTFSCLMWAISSLNMYVHEVPVSEQAWEVVMQISLGWVPAAMAIFLIRLDKKRFPRIEKTGLIIALLLNLAIILSPLESLFIVASSWHAYAISCGFLSIIYLAWSWWKSRKKEHAVILICIIIIALSGFYDLVIQLQWAGMKGERFLLNYSIPMVLIMIGYLMVNHFLNAIDESETLNRELESRVQKAQKHIETNYQRILSLETDQAANNERERIYRDLHDDLGGKLLSMVYRSNSEKMAGLARSALNDLREIVSHKPEISKKLNDELNDWIEECQTRCDEAAKKISFKLINIPENLHLPDESSRHIERMLREAITNVIKHSNGDDVRVTMHYRMKCLKITVADDGDYSTVQQWVEGGGLNSLRYRNKQLNGKIRWREKAVGGQVSWIIPLK